MNDDRQAYLRSRQLFAGMVQHRLLECKREMETFVREGPALTCEGHVVLLASYRGRIDVLRELLKDLASEEAA